ncbi:MAG: PASTA domain-containing protein [Flavobacteriales bacterium]
MFLISIGILYWSRGFLNSITNHGEKIKVPKIDSLTLMEAEKLLEEYDLKLSVDSIKFEEEYKPFQIYKQEPEAGNYVKKGRSISVKANPKTFRPVKLPDLIDRSIRLASQHLGLVSLKVGNITYEPHIAKDVVLKVLYNNQEAFPGQELPKYAVVDLVLGEGYKENVEIPNLRGLTLSEAFIVLKQVELSLGSVVKEKVTDSLSARIFDQLPSPGTMLEMGQPVNVWITNAKVEANETHTLAEFPDSLKTKETPEANMP